MNSLRHLLTIVTGLLAVFVCGSVLSAPYMISGEVIYLENQKNVEMVEEVEEADIPETDTEEGADEEAPEAAATTEEESEEIVFGPMSANVVITYEVTNDEEETEEVELVARNFNEGRFFFRENTTEPLELTISVAKNEEDTVSTTATLEPGKNLRFAYLVGSPDTYPVDRIVLVGQSVSAKEPAQKATVVADLSDANIDLSRAVAYVSGLTNDDEGEMVFVRSPEVMLHEDRFKIELAIDKPMAVFIGVSSEEQEYRSWLDAILEPGATVTLHSLEKSGKTLMYAEGGPRHAALVEVWQKSEEYQDATVGYEIAYDQWLAARELDDGSEPAEVDEEESDSAEMEEEAQDETMTVAEVEFAEGCEHVDASNTANIGPSYSWRDDYDRMNDLKFEMLEHLAQTSEDNINALLALDLGAYGYGRDQEKTLEVYDRVMASYEGETAVPIWLQTAYDDKLNQVEIVNNAKAIVVGQKAPVFTLPDRDGNEYNLTVVLEQQDTVLVDFWASWCGPCIASFPHLKEMHKAFAAEGFEIVGISIDDEMDDWLEALDEHELPWMNVGEILGDDTLATGSVGHTYGIRAIPTTVWIDSEGCIIGKNLSYDSLESALVKRYGEISTEDET